MKWKAAHLLCLVRLDQLQSRFDVLRDRLLAQNVFPSLQGFGNDFRLSVQWQGDDNSLNVTSSEKFIQTCE